MSRFFSFLRFLFPFRKFEVFGESMIPAYIQGNIVLVNTWVYFLKRPQVGDVIAIQSEHLSKVILKRIEKITKTGYYVTGDNTSKSTDSRTFGEIQKKEIVGKFFVKL